MLNKAAMQCNTSSYYCSGMLQSFAGIETWGIHAKGVRFPINYIKRHLPSKQEESTNGSCEKSESYNSMSNCPCRSVTNGWSTAGEKHKTDLLLVVSQTSKAAINAATVHPGDSLKTWH